jgi:3-phosphoshikimate 1-carboxyvinyltransferase
MLCTESSPSDEQDDHRMAMSFALAGLRIPGVTILEPCCVAKTYPEFRDALEKLRAEPHGSGP